MVKKPLVTANKQQSGGLWRDARARWEGNVLLPFEKLLAIIAIGQIFRIVIDASGFWDKVHSLLPGLKRKKKAQNSTRYVSSDETPVSFFNLISDPSQKSWRVIAHEALIDFQNQLASSQ